MVFQRPPRRPGDAMVYRMSWNITTRNLVQVRLSLDNKIRGVSREAAKSAKQEESTLAKAQRSQRNSAGYDKISWRSLRLGERTSGIESVAARACCSYDGCYQNLSVTVLGGCPRMTLRQDI